MNFNNRMIDIMQEWQIETGAEVIDIEAASKWACETNRYQRLPPTIQQLCKADMRRALQQSHYVDPQGNKVRAKHAVKLEYSSEQITLYIDVRTAQPNLVQQSFDQNWARIANDVKRHSIETQSFDLNNIYGAQLSLYDYDFNAQAEEARMTGEYDDEEEEEDLD